MSAYYNENDPGAVAWLRELIKQEVIADGIVDDRSIADVQPSDLKGFTQCHFFAGIGVWSDALYQAGWPDDREVWTGSCPCQPFSSAGKQGGKSDERHLWPEFYRLISQCGPAIVFGEQVSGKNGLAWLDDVQADLEYSDYAVGSATFPACSVGAPHLRQRLYWVAEDQLADTGIMGWDARSTGRPDRNPQTKRCDKTGQLESFSSTGILADTSSPGLEGYDGYGNGSGEPRRLETQPAGPVRESSRAGRVADTGGAGQETTMLEPGHGRQAYSVREAGRPGVCGVPHNTGPTNGHWADADWLGCRDGKWRAVEPGTFPLVDGSPARVVRLRGYGNAIVSPQAQAFVEAYVEAG